MIISRGRVFCLVWLATLTLACGGEGDTATGSQTAGSGAEAGTTIALETSAALAGPTLTIEGRAFGQAPEVAAGESFTLVNLDSARHTFSSADGSWEQVDLEGDSQVTFTVPQELAPGRYVFFCAIHSDMGGSLTVTG